MTDEEINDWLRQSHWWSGRSAVNLRVAAVKSRTGVFARIGDSLYYRDFFSPATGSHSFATDVLDLTKLEDHWVRRRAAARRVFGTRIHEMLEYLAGDVAQAAANEYLCHEGGHATGWAIGSKYETKYFQVNGSTAWPLVFVEEFRADMMSMGLVLDLLPLASACSVFAYHLIHRFGLASLSNRTGLEGAGAVPYLLFYLLVELGFIRVDPRSATIRIAVASLEPDKMAQTMRACAEHAAQDLTRPETLDLPSIDVAINAATYFRKRALDRNRAELYEKWMGR
jgi:hypothetical protein